MNPYPKPSDVGGTLIRAVIQNFKENAFALPLTKPTLIACSGGVDSMVLAHLLSRYGRNVIAPELITLLHFDHGWRKESATVERDAVKKLAASLGVKFLAHDLAPPIDSSRRSASADQIKSDNKEEDARLKRNEVYDSLAGESKPFAHVLTAHHLDDVIETLIWRFFRGEFLEQSDGILFTDLPMLRPFLKVLKEVLYEYAEAEKVEFFEDPTNQDSSQMRARMRQQVIPLLTELFPGMKRSLTQYLTNANLSQGSTSQKSPPEAVTFAIEQVMERMGVTSKLNRSQKSQIQNLMNFVKVGSQVSLPGGIRLTQQNSHSYTIDLVIK